MTFIISFSCFTGLSFTTTDDVTLLLLFELQKQLNNSNVFNTVPYIRTQMPIHILSLSRFLSYYAINSN